MRDFGPSYRKRCGNRVGRDEPDVETIDVVTVARQLATAPGHEALLVAAPREFTDQELRLPLATAVPRRQVQVTNRPHSLLQVPRAINSVPVT